MAEKRDGKADGTLGDMSGLNERTPEPPRKRSRIVGSAGVTTGPADRTPPHSNDAEAAVLGGIMLDERAFDKVRTMLTPDDFYREQHRIIYSAMCQLADRSQPVDIVTLASELRVMGKLADVGGALYLSELNMRTPTAAHIEHHSRIVYERSLKRQTIMAGMLLISDAYDPGIDAFDLVDRAQRSVLELGAKRAASPYRTAAQIAKAALDEYELRADRHAKGLPSGVETGLRELDVILGGFQKSDLIILAARPSMGKTAMATTLMRRLVTGGSGRLPVGVGLFSLEMSAQQVFDRLVSAESGIDGMRIRQGDLSKAEWENVIEATTRLAASPMVVDDSTSLTILDVRAVARRMVTEQNVGLIIIDYLQLMAGTGARTEQNREREIAVISRGLKQLAKELDIPVIALSQLNRSVESRGDKRPGLADLRESGAIEQDSDVVMFVHRPEYYGLMVDEHGRPTEGVAEIIVGKQRNGATGTARLAFIKDRALFENLSSFVGSPSGPSYSASAAAMHAHGPVGLPAPARAPGDPDDDFPF
jgi:replicative DNA helicase